MSQAFLNALASKSTYKAPTHEDNPSYTKLHVYDAFGKEKTETPTPVNPEWELHKKRVDYLLSLGYSVGDLCVVAVAHLYSAHKDDPEMPVHTVGVN